MENIPEPETELDEVDELEDADDQQEGKEDTDF